MPRRRQGQSSRVRVAEILQSLGLPLVFSHDVNHWIKDRNEGRQGGLSDGDPYRPQLLGSSPPLLRVEADLRGGGEAHHDRGNAVTEQDAERSDGELDGIDHEVIYVGVVDARGGQKVDRHPDGCEAGESDVLEQDAEEGYPKVRILAVVQGGHAVVGRERCRLTM
jgi:hypothetical protein